MKSNKGFTLLELMVTIAIMGILLSFAIPSYRNMQNDAIATSIVNEWRDSFYYAQAEAMRLKRNITFCASDPKKEVCGNNWKNGWLVLISNDEGGVARILRDVIPSVPKGSDFEVKLKKPNSESLTIRPNGNIDDFRGASLQAYLKENNQILARRGIVISREGRIKAKNDFTVASAASGTDGD